MLTQTRFGKRFDDQEDNVGTAFKLILGGGIGSGYNWLRH
jgi:hypothetical protein